MTVHRPNNVHSAVQRLNRPPSSTGRPKTTTASSTSLSVSQISSQSTSSSSGNECVKVVVRSVLRLYPNPIAFFRNRIFLHIPTFLLVLPTSQELPLKDQESLQLYLSSFHISGLLNGIQSYQSFYISQLLLHPSQTLPSSLESIRELRQYRVDLAITIIISITTFITDADLSLLPNKLKGTIVVLTSTPKVALSN